MHVYYNFYLAYIEEAISFQLLHDHRDQNYKCGGREADKGSICDKIIINKRGLLIMGDAMHILENTVRETPLAAAR